MPQSILHIAVETNGEDIKTRTHELGLGKAKDYAEYRYICGVIQGLRMSNANLQGLEQQIEEEDD